MRAVFSTSSTILASSPVGKNMCIATTMFQVLTGTEASR
jgi:hypothetical protein